MGTTPVAVKIQNPMQVTTLYRAMVMKKLDHEKLLPLYGVCACHKDLFTLSLNR